MERPEKVRKVLSAIHTDGLALTLSRVFDKLDSPASLGYSCAGTVVDVSRDADGFSVGDGVACAGQNYASHAEMVYVPKHLCVKIPDGVDSEDASFVTLGAIALQGVRQAEPRLGDRIAVIGLGLLGQLTVQLLKASGCRVLGSDLDQSKLQLAQLSGADVVVPSSDLANAAEAFADGQARRALAPLRAIRQGAAAVTATRLEYRLPVDSVPVELADLARTLNDMLERLQASFRRLSDFSSDIAHELRTPVSNLLTQTQVTLSKARTPDEYRDILASNAEEFERLSRMIADMLFLAKSDNDLIVPCCVTIDLAAEVKSLFEFYEALAEERAIQLDCSGSGMVSGDRLMLRRAINNLLSNAIRYTSAGGRIAVRIAEADGSALKLSVENTGETIPSEHLSRLFDRFYRVDSSRQRFSEGAGLGLAITRSIVRAHGSDAFVRSEQGVTTFELQIPV